MFTPKLLLSILTSKLTYIILALVIATSYFFYAENRIESLKADREALKTQVKEITDRQNKLISDIKRAEVSGNEILKQKEVLLKQYNALQETLYRENYGKMPLEKIAAAKPKLVEKKVNDATKNEFDCFEKIAGGSDENC